MCGEKGIFTAFEALLAVFGDPTDKGGSDSFRDPATRRERT